VAIHPGDHPDHPLPAPPAPLPLFEAVKWPQIAQKNLTLMHMNRHVMTMVLTVSAHPRMDKIVRVVAEVGGELPRQALASLGLNDVQAAPDQLIEVGLSLERGCVGEGDPVGDPELGLQIGRGESEGVQVNVRDRGLQRDQYQLVRIEERGPDGNVLGGIGLVVVAGSEG
jgi:hypothetical protein